MCDKEAWEEMWRRKGAGEEMFAHAELTVDKTLRKWNQRRPGLPEYTVYECKAGTTVLITCVSRFGHACIRGQNVDEARHGYDGTIQPDQLKSLRFL